MKHYETYGTERHGPHSIQLTWNILQQYLMMSCSTKRSTETLRWNERKLAEMKALEEDSTFHARTGRIDKWKEVTRIAAAEQKLKVDLPDKIEYLVMPRIAIFLFYASICRS